MYTNKEALNILDADKKTEAILHIVENLLFVNRPDYEYLDDVKAEDYIAVKDWVNTFDFQFLSLEETVDAIMDVVSSLMEEHAGFVYNEESENLDRKDVTAWLNQPAVMG